MLLLGLCAIPLCIDGLQAFREHRILGVLMIILSKMLYDVFLFLVIFAAVSLGFARLSCVAMGVDIEHQPSYVARRWPLRSTQTGFVRTSGSRARSSSGFSARLDSAL